MIGDEKRLQRNGQCFDKLNQTHRETIVIIVIRLQLQIHILLYFVLCVSNTIKMDVRQVFYACRQFVVYHRFHKCVSVCTSYNILLTHNVYIRLYSSSEFRFAFK